MNREDIKEILESSWANREFDEFMSRFEYRQMQDKIESLQKEQINVSDEVITLRQKYIDAELKHFRGTKEKSKSIRAKVSVLDELLSLLNLNDRGHKSIIAESEEKENKYVESFNISKDHNVNLIMSRKLKEIGSNYITTLESEYRYTVFYWLTQFTQKDK